jgi:hypothetical protein
MMRISGGGLVRSFCVLAALGFVAGCGGGGGGSSAPAVPTPAASVATVPASVAVPVSTSNSTSVAVGASGTTANILIPPATSGSGTLTVLEANTLPSGAPALSTARHASSTRYITSVSPTFLAYVSFTASATVTFAATPSFSFTLPSTVSLSGMSIFVAGLLPGATSWAEPLIPQPATVNGQIVTIPALTQSFTILAGQTYAFALYAVPNTSPSPSPTATSTASPSASPSPSPSASANAVRAKSLYVGDSPTQFIYVFPATATGAAMPSASLSGSNTLISGPSFLFLDNASHLWASQVSSTVVTAYNTSALIGNQAPATTITGFGNPSGLYVSASGAIYVADSSKNAIDVFANGASGGMTTQIIGSNTGLSWPQGLWLDASGRIYVANPSNNTIEIFAANPASGTQNIAPVATIGGSATALAEPFGITIDASGNLWAANLSGNSVVEFAPGATGNVAPITTIGSTALNGPWGIVVDAAGYVYVGNNGAGTVDVFAPGTSGTASVPVQVLSGGGGGSTPFACPMGLALR